MKDLLAKFFGIVAFGVTLIPSIAPVFGPRWGVVITAGGAALLALAGYAHSTPAERSKATVIEAMGALTSAVGAALRSPAVIVAPPPAAPLVAPTVPPASPAAK